MSDPCIATVVAPSTSVRKIRAPTERSRPSVSGLGELAGPLLSVVTKATEGATFSRKAALEEVVAP